MEKVSLLKEKVNNLTPILKHLIEEDVFFNPEGIKIGVIEKVEVLDKMNKDKQAYNQIQFIVRTPDNKVFTKRYSVDFTRKFLVQLGVKAAELTNVTVVFKASGKFNGMGWFAFVSGEHNDGGEMTYDIHPYKDEGEDFSEKLAKLGI